MSQKAENTGAMMPPMVKFFLTKRVPCAFIVVMMLTSAYWFDALFGNIPLIGFLLVLLGMALHLTVPSVFALVLFGGGLGYSLQVGGIAALGILMLSSGSVYAVLIFLGLFVLVPVLIALAMQRQGLNQASWRLAIAIFLLVVAALMIAMDAEGIKAFVTQMFKPMFDSLAANVPAGETVAVESLRQLQKAMIDVFPGLLVLSLWLIWWGNILFARKLAKRFGFYQGDDSTMLTLFLPRQLVYILFVFALISSVAEGDLQYIAMSGMFVLSGLLAVQGIVVAHAWLKSRGMMNSIVVMYVMLFFWSIVIVVFMMIGLFDIWFNFRRNIISATGEK